MNNIDIKAPLNIVRDFFLKPDIVLRLNPSWYVKEIKVTDKALYEITLYDDRTNETSLIFLNVEVWEKSISYKINSSRIEFLMDEINPAVIRLSISGDFFKVEDLPYWLKGLKNYIQLEARQSKIIKALLDRLWLRMMPSHRRITIIIIFAEIISLIVLIAFIISLKII